MCIRDRFEDRTVRVPGDIDIREALHAVRMTHGVGNRPRFDAARTADGHADAFWALAMACNAAQSPDAFPRAGFASGGVA